MSRRVRTRGEQSSLPAGAPGRTEAVVLAAVANARRSRIQDLARLALFVAETAGSLELTHERESFAIGTNLMVKDCLRALHIPPALYDAKTDRHDWSPDQIHYVRSLIHDLPNALRVAIK